ncbi:hypothetical protein CNR22_10410 [Sphingobacteriaceae bacterium]|nr:hypothetical protein CNR22_10410 [Sphingobacteriaceae bacterium]
MKKKATSPNSVKVFLTICLVFILMHSTNIYAYKDKNLKHITQEKPKPEEVSLAESSGWLKHQNVEFLENKGQIMNTDDKPATNVLFKAEAPGLDLYITKTGLSYVFLKYEEEKHKEKRKGEAKKEEREEEKISYERLDLDLAGATILSENILKEDTGIAYFNFLLAKDNVINHVKKYRKITIKNVYPGIDWVLYNSSASGFKYDFIVHPGADPKNIQLVYKSKRSLSIDTKGNLLIPTSLGTIEEKAPYSYIKDSEKNIESKFKLISSQKKGGMYETSLGFDLGETNYSSTTLIIDPQLVWSTFYGGTSNEGTLCIDTDPSGNVFLCGYLGSTDFPLLSMGTYFQATPGTSSGFLVKFNNTGTLLWSTFFGPARVTYLATDKSGNVYVCGSTQYTAFPTVNNNTYFQSGLAGSDEAFISKFDNLGNYVWGTYYGGSGGDEASSVATDQSGNVFLVGSTYSTDFPTQNASTYFESSLAGMHSGFIVKFDNTGSRLWATYLKGMDWNPVAATDVNGRVYITGFTNTLIPLNNPGGSSFYQGTLSGGTDAYLIRFSNTGSLQYGTYYGGSNGSDYGTSLATDKYANVFITGYTSSTNFPLQNAGTYFQAANTGSVNDVFIVKFDSTLTRKWATYIGGSRDDTNSENDNITIDTCGNVFLGITTLSRNLPFVQACDGGMYDHTLDTSLSTSNLAVYLARFSNNGDLMWSSYFCGDGNSFRTTLAADAFGNVFFSGEWNGVVNPSTYPLVYPSSSTYTQAFMGSEDLYVAKFTNNLGPQHFSYPPLCTSNPNQLPNLATGFLTGGTFSASPGLSLNPVTGQITPSLSTAGNYTITYKMAPCYCPGAVPVSAGSTTVSLIAGPSLSIAGKTSMCLKENRTYTVSGGTTYTWNTSSNSSTISANPTTTATIVYTVSSKSSNGCLATKTLSITVSKCTGVDEVEMGQAKLNIYPNPNSGQFTVSSDTDIKLVISNELGQLIQELELSAKNERKVVIQNLPTGIYFIKDKKTNQTTNYKIVVTN